LKKIEREKAQNDAKTTEEVSDTQNGQDRDPDLPAYTDETDEEAVPDVEDAIPVDIRDAIDTADIVSDGNEDEPDEDEPDEDEPDEDDDI
jgi:hypothetical protein